MRTRIRIPKNYPVQPLGPNDKAMDRATCGTCGLSWDDAICTSMTPAPSGRCPFETFHKRTAGDTIGKPKADDEPDDFYMSSQPCEIHHKAALCACCLIRDEFGRIKMYQCNTHAAAPELLSLVRQAETMLREFAGEDPGECMTAGSPRGEACELADEIQAAIAKAEGR